MMDMFAELVEPLIVCYIFIHVEQNQKGFFFFFFEVQVSSKSGVTRTGGCLHEDEGNRRDKMMVGERGMWGEEEWGADDRKGLVEERQGSM